MTYDAIIIGGGLAGSALADQLARANARVLVLERETQFKDRVRGENILPWGTAAARRLGLYETLIDAGGHTAPIWQTYTMGAADQTRDLQTTTPGGDTMVNIYHPHMQDAVLARAVSAGADVIRGAIALSIHAEPGKMPSVTFEHDGKNATLNARIIVGADGRASLMRSWGGFDVQRNPELLIVAGMLIGGTNVPEGAAIFAMGPGIGSFWAPLGDKKSRTYFVYPAATGRRGLSGKHKVGDFLQAVRAVGVPSAWLDGVEPLGPLAEFDGADRWVDSPAKDGVVLIGDAAAASDPSWGSGLSLSLLDVESLSNALRSNPDWNAALAQYAAAHDEYYGALHRIQAWMTELVWTPGPVADERRNRVFARMMRGPQGFPDMVGLGPFGPSDDTARRLMLGLE
ncbi:MAG TPA: NAD(P)/FAD-dependent oxidoreductase [Gemmatimonadaceae bacterium]|nr:NAD(P)/FAD-dependent oxidoreductase [Gemmatimonadaceae bacterium]